MKRSLAAVLLFTLACGGSNEGSKQTLNPAMGKTWTGTTTVSIVGLATQPAPYAGQFTVAVNGNTATATDVCPNGGGSIVATANGSNGPGAALWSGSMACPGIPQTGSNCSLVLTYTAAELILSTDFHTLNAVGSGTVTGCGMNTTFTISFTGT
jgi:hypothetical protein